MMVIDLWEKLAPLFTQERYDYPEIDFHYLSSDELHQCLVYLMTSAHGVMTAYRLKNADEEVAPVSVEAASLALIRGYVKGVIWAEWPRMPRIALFVDEQRLSLSYECSPDWTALSLMVLFDLLDQLQHIAPQAVVRLNATMFSSKQRNLFHETWRQYRHGAP